MQGSGHAGRKLERAKAKHSELLSNRRGCVMAVARKGTLAMWTQTSRRGCT